VAAAARGAEDKLGQDTIVLDVGDVLAITGYFIVTSGANTRQVKTITEGVEESVDKVGGPKPIRVEGLDALQWVLMDFGGFVVHVFGEEARQFYALERLWKDVPRVEWRQT